VASNIWQALVPGGASTGAQSARGSQRPASAPPPAPGSGAQTARPSTPTQANFGATKPDGAKHQNHINTKHRVYPEYPPQPPGPPMSGTNVARVSRVKEKLKDLDKQFLGRGIHSSTFRLNISTFCGIRWVRDSPPVY